MGQPVGSAAAAAGRMEALGRPLLAGLLAAGLTAFVWLPAFLESGAVQYRNAFNFVQVRRYTAASVTAGAGDGTRCPGVLFGRYQLPHRAAAVDRGAAGGVDGPLARRAPAHDAVLRAGGAGGVWADGAAGRFCLAAGARCCPICSSPSGCWVCWCRAWPGWPGRRRSGIARAGAGGCWWRRRWRAYFFAAVPMLTPLPWPDFGPVTPRPSWTLICMGSGGSAPPRTANSCR